MIFRLDVLLHERDAVGTEAERRERRAQRILRLEPYDAGPGPAHVRLHHEREPEPLPTMFTMLVGTYWPPGLPKFPVSSHSSFSR